MNEDRLRSRLTAADATVPVPPLTAWAPETLERRLRHRRLGRAGVALTTAVLLWLAVWPRHPEPPPAAATALPPAVDSRALAIQRARLAHRLAELRELNRRAEPALDGVQMALARSRATALFQARVSSEEFADEESSRDYRARADRYRISR